MGGFSTHLSVQHLLKQGPRSAGAPQAELVELRGVRLAIAAEPGDKEFLDMGQVKLLTSGGDMLKARGVYSANPVEFIQTHSLFLHCNSIPRSTGGDKGLADRLRIIPFEARFIEPSAGPADPENHIYHRIDSVVLSKLLEKEMSGILAWAVGSAISVLRSGLPHCPQRVIDETEEYLTDNDIVSQFFKSECEKDKSSTIEAIKLYSAFSQFCSNNLLFKESKIPSLTAFGRMMRSFCKKKRTNQGIIYLGIKFINEELYQEKENNRGLFNFAPKNK
jgi:putative DNA primase/helicase